MKEKFAPQEWHLLKLLPFLVFNFVLANLTGVKKFKVEDATPLMELLRGLIGAQSAGDPLLRELALDTTQSEWQELVAESMDPSKIERSAVGGDVPSSDRMLMLLSRMLKARDLLHDKLIREQYQAFLMSVLLVAGFLPFQDIHKKAKKPAAEAMAKLAEIFSVEPI